MRLTNSNKGSEVHGAFDGRTAGGKRGVKSNSTKTVHGGKTRDKKGQREAEGRDREVQGEGVRGQQIVCQRESTVRKKACETGGERG